MGKVSTGLSMSLDGFIAGLNDGPERPLGEGGERLFAWYSGGDTEYRLPGTEMVFRVSPQSAELLREAHSKMGAFVTGRRTRRHRVLNVVPRACRLCRQASPSVPEWAQVTAREVAGTDSALPPSGCSRPSCNYSSP
jgi:hypothetical protein